MKPTYGMKVSLLAIAVLSVPFLAHAQDLLSFPATKAACGSENIKFDVSLDQSQQQLLKPTNGKAVIYILQDFPAIHALSHFTTRIGVDGSWAGANKDRSYSGFMIDPGLHHLCVSGQWGGPKPSVALHQLQAKAGEIYYFAIRFSYFGAAGGIILDLEPVDEDQGQFMLQSSKSSSSHSK